MKTYCNECHRQIEEVEYYNKEADEGEEYCVIEAECTCGKEFQFEEWGSVESKEEAMELLHDNIEHPIFSYEGFRTITMQSKTDEEIKDILSGEDK